MISRFDYDEIVGPPPEKEKNALFVLYRYMSDGKTKVYKSKFDDGKYGHITRTTLRNKAMRCNAAGAAYEASKGEWYIERVEETTR
jgi:hypothetical protein